MNVSPILLLSVGASFAFLYGLIITVGWAITRKNRKKYHESEGITEIELYDLQKRKTLDKYVKAVSLSNNHFKDENDQLINPDKFNCYIVGNVSSDYPNIEKGNLIFINLETNEIEYAFEIPSLENFR